MSQKDRLFYKTASGERKSEVAEKTDIAGLGHAFGLDNGSEAGQEVLHLHAHFMGGKKIGRL